MVPTEPGCVGAYEEIFQSAHPIQRSGEARPWYWAQGDKPALRHSQKPSRVRRTLSTKDTETFPFLIFRIADRVTGEKDSSAGHSWN